MESASDFIQIQTKEGRSRSILLFGSDLPLAADLQSPANMLNKDEAISADDCAIKVRKQYTITKERERWTDEEHNKFLEALKLYGRAWRQIKEHVGTKTAVQIRSHAQKFFSKVLRESSINEENTVKSIEIPPPRPKRKPVHPYPRKNVGPFTAKAHLSDEPWNSASPSLSALEQKTQSPASVLSVVASEATGVTDSNMPNVVILPAPDPDDQPSGLLRSETISLKEEKGSENGSNSPEGNNSSIEDEHVSKKLELFPEDGAFVKERSNEEVSTQTLKLFGKTVTVMVAEPSLSSSRDDSCSSPLPESTNERLVQTSPWNISPGKIFSASDASVSHGVPAVYYMQFPIEKPNNVDYESTTHVPFRDSYGGVPYPFLQLHTSVPKREYNYYGGKNVQDEVLQKHGLVTGSNTRSINAKMDVESNLED